MLHVDILSAYCLCGASALVAAGLLLLAKVDDAKLARAIRVMVGGFVVVAIGLFPLGFIVDDGGPRHPLFLLATLALLGGTALFGWGFAFLRGAQPPRAAPVLVALMLAADVVAWTRSPFDFELVFNALAVTIAIAITGSQWRDVGLGGTRAERAVTASLFVYTLAWGVRFAFTVSSDGSRSFYVAHLPSWLLPWMGLFYGMVPVIVAGLTLNLVNERLSDRLRAMADTDELTGTLSRRALRERAPGLRLRHRDQGRAVAAIMIDIDHFKRVNDSHGHLGGDAVLKRAAQLVSQNLRSDSVVTRYGGEEFAVLLPVLGLDEARAVAERLRKAFEAEVVEFEGARIGVTISVGLALMTPDELLEDALKRADEALYRAKNGGRNRIDVALEAA
ncbi:MAG: GGDEF domain-containing protein [Burkholderiaceae bacterium]